MASEPSRQRDPPGAGAVLFLATPRRVPALLGLALGAGLCRLRPTFFEQHEQQAPHQPQILEKLRLLSLMGLGITLLPERVADDGRRDQRGEQDGGGQTRKPTQSEGTASNHHRGAVEHDGTLWLRNAKACDPRRAASGIKKGVCSPFDEDHCQQ